MRYCETGQLHLDFYRTLNGTIAYLRRTYGRGFLKETFRRTGRDVYRAIREDLKQGDARQLVEHWTYFMDREGGRYSLTEGENETVLRVDECPAVAFLKRQGIEPDPDFCLQTVVINDALAEETPFEISTRVLGDGRCVQTVRRRP